MSINSHPDSTLIACCDIGGTKTLVGLVNGAGDLLASERYAIGDRAAPQQVAADIALSLERLLESTGRARSELAGFGCSTTGVMDVTTGIVSMNHNLGWPTDVPFRDLLAAQLGLPVVLEMDANAAALGEAWTGNGRGCRSFAFVIVGTGVGSGLLFDGRVWHGAHSSAGEIGHTVIVPGGPLCGCGKHGCLEALASGLAIARRANAALTLGRPSSLRGENQPVTAEQVARHAAGGDALASQIMDETAFYLGIGLANLITLLDLEAIVLGGGVGRGAFDLLLPGIQRSVQQHLNYWAVRDLPIRATALGDFAGLIGAGRAVLDYLRPESIYQESNK